VGNRPTRRPPRREDQLARLAVVIGYTATGAWAASFIVNIANPAYNPPASVHAVMMIVAGGAFGIPLFRKPRGDE
jgi:hypothetical protein